MTLTRHPGYKISADPLGGFARDHERNDDPADLH
jgi:hypothetical protein